ncbi:SGNH/GDSL hydrolase family protein [Asticcacaulis excentricus]|uniref:Lipolytic protein G-D-S-L family n=1 Tax=Asticcacaulis excentricus (strain ATCC 15261 / DSM 4724 / KCTC 12464 / NCIMB 9791 / VKM B-1370 / CB 48) TaxID=573065 RepID=E8RUW0_ASTEC|nr:SGNH/GDSL hydrolase family protein [Asticcacaulis excentricus]ADU14160.1 lipolytic protein G-D-S-L family [Asticcacaulis excentricus CB 48]
MTKALWLAKWLLAGTSFAAVAAADTLPLHNGGRSAAPAYTHQWPGAYFETATASKSVTLSFDDSTNIYKLSLNGEVVKVIEKPGQTTVRFDSKSTKAVDVYRLEKITESQGQTGRFLGFSADKPAALTARARQIEFIGDSYTVGYGNTSPKRDCTNDEVWATTDTSQAFGPLTAKHYEADYQVNAFSGRGIVRNYNGFIGDPLPKLYPYSLFDGKTAYDATGWQPQIIVIGLGTNDFSTALNPGEKWTTREALQGDYRDTYVAFVRALRAKNPQAQFILMASDGASGEIRAQVAQVAKTLKDTGETRVDTLFFDGLDFGGCHYHPSLADDRKIAGLIQAWIDSHPGVWQGK